MRGRGDIEKWLCCTWLSGRNSNNVGRFLSLLVLDWQWITCIVIGNWRRREGHWVACLRLRRGEHWQPIHWVNYSYCTYLSVRPLRKYALPPLTAKVPAQGSLTPFNVPWWASSGIPKLHVHSCIVDVDDTSHLTVTLLQEIPGNVTWYMTDSIAVLEDGYSEVIVNVLALVLKWQLFSQMKRDHTWWPPTVLAIVRTFVTVNMNLGSVIIVWVCSNTFWGGVCSRLIASSKLHPLPTLGWM